MTNISDPQTILKIEKCGDLFPNNPEKAKLEFRRLAKRFHPDSSSGDSAEDVFKHINELYVKADEMFSAGTWEATNYIEISSSTGRLTKLKYLRMRCFELGVQYIANNVVVYVLDGRNKKYYDNMVRSIKKIRYRDPAMEKEFSRYMPEILDAFESTEGKWVIAVSKSPDVFLLKDLLEHFNGSIEDRHVAWMISRLCNLCCFLDFNHLSHNGISLDNCYVSPEYHSILLLGGWWYCVPQGEKMIGTQAHIFDIMTPKVKTDKIGSIMTDLESVKLLAATLLGKTKAPDTFDKWVQTGSSGSAVDDFEKWNKALNESYGARKFITMELSQKDIYK